MHAFANFFAKAGIGGARLGYAGSRPSTLSEHDSYAAVRVPYEENVSPLKRAANKLELCRRQFVGPLCPLDRRARYAAPVG